MKTLKILVSFGAILSLSLAFTSAAAGVANAAVGVSTAANANAYGTVSVSGSAKGGSSTTDSGASSGSNANANSNVNENSDVIINDASGTGADVSVNGADMSVGGTADISLKGDDVRSSGNVDTSISSAAQVGSNVELESYAKTVAYNNATVDVVSTSDNQVAVTYKRPAKLFGFIPVHVKETVKVDVNAEGTASVSVGKSWWAFLAADDLMTGTVSAKLESTLSAHGAFDTSAGASLSAAAKAQILSVINSSEDAVYAASY